MNESTYSKSDLKNQGFRSDKADSGKPARPSTKAKNSVFGGLEDAEDFEPLPIEYLVEGIIEKGELVIISGKGGVGKGLISMDLTAAITTGRDFFNGSKAKLAHVIILSKEDSKHKTIIPRLMAAGADRSRTKFFNPRKGGEDGLELHPTFGKHDFVDALKDAILRLGDVDFVVIDPLSSYIGDLDKDKEGQIRQMLDALSEVAQVTGATIFIVAHNRKGKGSKGEPDQDEVAGSVAIVNAARNVLIVDQDSKGRYLKLVKANNSEVDGTKFYFDVEKVPISADRPDFLAPRIAWRPLEAASVNGKPNLANDPKKTRAAKEFLLEALACGPRYKFDVFGLATPSFLKGEFGTQTLENAAEGLGIVREKEKKMGGRTLWSLPDYIKVPCPNAPSVETVQ